LVPLALGLKDKIEATFEGTTVAGYGFLVTAAMLVTTVWLSRREGGKGPAETRWSDALLIGLAQMVAPLPGVSRSGMTIAAALALGLSRTWAVGFSLLMAVPAILGAAVFEIKKVDPSTLNADRIAQTVAASALAGVIGYGAIVWLVKIVKSGRMWYFSVYLIVLGAGVLTSVAIFGDVPHAGKANASDRSVGSEHPRSVDPGGEGGSSRALDRPFTTGPGSNARGARQEAGGLALAPGLVLERSLERRRGAARR
jgi:undecaprenyl-diphosphatase